MSRERTLDKYRLIRILRIMMDMDKNRTDWVCGEGWSAWEIEHLRRLDEHVQRKINVLYNAFGEETEGAIEFLEEIMTKILEGHSNANEELRKLLPRQSMEAKRILSEQGFSRRDVNRAARELNVLREYKPKMMKAGPLKGKNKLVMWWSLPDDD